MQNEQIDGLATNHSLAPLPKQEQINNMIKVTMFVKGPPASHNFLKIIACETILKIFLMSTYITTQSWCRLRRVWMPKGMASKPPRVDTPN